MPSYSSIFIYSMLALGAAAQKDYGYAAPSTPASASYGPMSVSSSSSAATSTMSPTMSSEMSSTASPAQATAATAACPLNFEKGCAFLCSGPKSAPSCKTEWIFSAESSCTPCPGIPDKCPASAEPSCAFVCKAQGAAASKGDAETPFCSAKDVSADEADCTPCGAASGGSVNATSVTPEEPVSNSTIASYGNGTTSVPPPIYTSGASTLTIGVSVVFGLSLAFFTL